MFLDAVERRATEYQGGTLTSPNPFGLVSLLTGSVGGTTAGVAVDEWTAEGIPAIYACQRAYSETVGQLPCKLMAVADKVKTPAVDDQLYYVLKTEANSEQGAFAFREMMTRFLMSWGNAYAEIERNAQGQVIALWPLVPWGMYVDRDPATNKKRWRYRNARGQSFEWIDNPARRPILHLMINSIDGLVGRSPIRVEMDSIGLTQATNQFGAIYFQRGTQSNFVAIHKGKIGPEGRRNFRESWEEVNGGWANKQRLLVLSEDVKLEKLSTPPDEAQFLETRSFQIEECARIYRMPLVMIQHMTKSTSWGSGVEMAMLGWLAMGLSPVLEQWKQELARTCISTKVKYSREVVFVTAALLRTDFSTTITGLATQIQNRIINPNEARDYLDLNPVEGGDEFAPWKSSAPSTTQPGPRVPQPNEGDNTDV